MKPHRLGLVGATGRMGQCVTQILANEPAPARSFELVYAVSGPKDPAFLDMARAKPDVVIDFSSPESSLAAAELCAKNNIPILIGTTGFSDEQRSTLAATLAHKRWALTPNTSLGVQVLTRALVAALKSLPEDFVVSIEESHHRNKKDRPSGTAKSLAAVITENFSLAAPEIHSRREGDEIGTHTVVFTGPDERIELTHRALDRNLFARGALALAAKLIEAPKRSAGDAWSAADLLNQ